MSRKIRLTEEADRHLTEAASWYERQRAGLGREFLDELLSAFPLLAEHPSQYPVVHSDIRRAPMRRFPYGGYFGLSDPDLSSWQSFTHGVVPGVGSCE